MHRFPFHRSPLSTALRRTQGRWCSADASSSSSLPSSRATKSTGWLLRWIGVSAAITFGFTSIVIVSWPFVDGWGLPWCYRKILHDAKPKVAPKKANFPEEVQEELMKILGKANGSDLESQGNESAVALIIGPPKSGKSSLPALILSQANAKATSTEGQSMIYINCRSYTDPATMLYGTLVPLFVGHLGMLGSFLVAYHKLFNAAIDFFTMGQQHEHVSHIIFAQCIGHMRQALFEFKRYREQQKAKGGPVFPLPIVVIDSFEEIIKLVRECHPHSDTAVVAKMFIQIFLRTACDEDLAHLVLLADSSVLERSPKVSQESNGNKQCSLTRAAPSPLTNPLPLQVSETKLYEAFPELVDRAAVRFLPHLNTTLRSMQGEAQGRDKGAESLQTSSTTVESLQCLMKEEGVQPLLLREAIVDLQQVRNQKALTPSDLCNRYGVSLFDGNAALNQLTGLGLCSPVIGSSLMESVPNPKLQTGARFIGYTPSGEIYSSTMPKALQPSLSLWLRSGQQLAESLVPFSILQQSLDMDSVAPFCRSLRQMGYLWRRPALLIDAPFARLDSKEGAGSDGHSSSATGASRTAVLDRPHHLRSLRNGDVLSSANPWWWWIQLPYSWPLWLWRW
jgi:hypothetical protein